MRRAPRFVLIGSFIALVPATGRAQTIGECDPHPTRIFGWGFVASFVLGTEPAIAIGIQADYLAFAAETSRTDETRPGHHTLVQCDRCRTAEASVSVAQG